MLVGDGINPLFVTGTTASDPSANRGITLIGLSARNGSATSPGSEVIRLWTAYNFSLIDCAFSRYQGAGNSSSGANPLPAAVSIYNSANGTIRDCYISASQGPWGVGVYAASNVLNCQNSVITGGSAGGAVDIAGCAIVRFNGCTIQSSLLGFRVCGTGGQCIGVNLDDNYMEAVGTPYDIGRTNLVKGLSIQRGHIENANVVKALDTTEENIFILGSVQGWKRV